MSKASNVTVVHLIKVSRNAKVSTARVPLSLAEDKGELLTRIDGNIKYLMCLGAGKLYAYCRDCKALTVAREVLICKNCNKVRCRA